MASAVQRRTTVHRSFLMLIKFLQNELFMRRQFSRGFTKVLRLLHAYSPFSYSRQDFE
jgi:hypothetical protein